MEKLIGVERETELPSMEDSQLQGQEQLIRNQEDSFVWDENSQLYYHARSGFYHDPNAGWYYSTRDGFYYKFENGNYVLLDSYNEGDQSEIEGQGEATLGEYGVETTCEKDCGQSNQETEGETAQRGVREGMSDEGIESHPPPSEWLEDTLIELYLSGYPSKASNADNVGQLTDEIEERDSSLLSADGNNTHGQGDDEWNIDCQATTDSSVDEGASWDEENWRAQYGQVIQEEAELSSWIPAVELWDWSLVKETQKELNYEVVRLVGRLVRPSHKLHPSVPPGGSRLRTAPVCRVHLDLVQGKFIS